MAVAKRLVGRSARWLPGLAVVALSCLVLAPSPAAAMCGGNLFLSCPVNAKTSQRPRKASSARRRHPLRATADRSSR